MGSVDEDSVKGCGEGKGAAGIIFSPQSLFRNNNVHMNLKMNKFTVKLRKP